MRLAFPGSLLAALAAVCVGCGVAGSRPALQNAFPSPEATATAVLDALWQRDRTRLTAAAIGQREFRDLVWPRLPASRPDVGMPLDYLWADTRTKSDAYLTRTIDEHGGSRLALVSVSFAGPLSDYEAFRIHRRTQVTVRDLDGRQRVLELFGSMIESTDGWKIYSYITD